MIEQTFLRISIVSFMTLLITNLSHYYNSLYLRPRPITTVTRWDAALNKKASSHRITVPPRATASHRIAVMTRLYNISANSCSHINEKLA